MSKYDIDTSLEALYGNDTRITEHLTKVSKFSESHYSITNSLLQIIVHMNEIQQQHQKILEEMNKPKGWW